MECTLKEVIDDFISYILYQYQGIVRLRLLLPTSVPKIPDPAVLKFPEPTVFASNGDIPVTVSVKLEALAVVDPAPRPPASP